MKISFKITRENEDGSADALCDYDDEGLQVIVQYGVIAMLKEAMEDKKMVKSQKTRLDLEDAIQGAFSIADDLKTLFEHHGAAPTPMSEDEVSNVLLGLHIMAQIKLDKVWDKYIRHEQLDAFASEAAKDARKGLFENDDDHWNRGIDDEDDPF